MYIVDIIKRYKLNTTIIHTKMTNNNNNINNNNNNNNNKGGCGISVSF